MTNSARKGRNGERDVRDLLTQFNIKNRLHGIYEADDLTIDVLGKEWIVEAKIRASGFSTLYSALDGRQLFFARANRKPWLVIQRADDYLPILRRALESITTGEYFQNDAWEIWRSGR